MALERLGPKSQLSVFQNLHHGSATWRQLICTNLASVQHEHISSICFCATESIMGRWFGLFPLFINGATNGCNNNFNFVHCNTCSTISDLESENTKFKSCKTPTFRFVLAKKVAVLALLAIITSCPRSSCFWWWLVFNTLWHQATCIWILTKQRHCWDFSNLSRSWSQTRS